MVGPIFERQEDGILLVYGRYTSGGWTQSIALRDDLALGPQVRFGTSRFHGNWELQDNGTTLEITFDCKVWDNSLKITTVHKTDDPGIWRGQDSKSREVSIQWTQCLWLPDADPISWLLLWSDLPTEVDIYPRPAAFWSANPLDVFS